MYSKNGNIYSIGQPATEWLDKLPSKVFSVVETLFGFALEEMFDRFELPSKLYGSTAKQAARVLNTFNDRKSSTGVLMIGEKGSGKSLLAKKIANDSGLPVLLLTTARADEEFFKFLKSIEQPCVVFIDEFEKVYAGGDDGVSQDALLTLLDGTMTMNNLYLLTANDRSKVNDFMFNRPGRIYYQFIFDGLEESFIREYLEDQGLSRQRIGEIADFAEMFWSFNFDMLQALTEEIKRYNESPFEAARVLNMNIEGGGMNYSAQVFRDGKKIYEEDSYVRSYPLQQSRLHIQFPDPGLLDSEGDPEWISMSFVPQETLQKQRGDMAELGQFVFKTKYEHDENTVINYTIVLAKQKRDTRFWGAF